LGDFKRIWGTPPILPRKDRQRAIPLDFPITLLKVFFTFNDTSPSKK
jgi:hypothetical protein